MKAVAVSSLGHFAAEDRNQYEATQNEDGTYNILGVPVFGEVPAGAKGNKEAIGREWMAAALKAFRRDSKGGYLPPLHLHHHGFDDTRRAGHFRLTKLQRILYEGKGMWALFADLVQIPADIFAMIRDGEFPYRSVEIVDVDSEEEGERRISSLALLDDDEPFFRFKLLNGDTIRAADLKPMPAALLPLFQAAIRGGARTAVLFSFKGGSPMKLVVSGNPTDGFTLHDEKGNEFKGEIPASATFKFTPTKGWVFQDKDEKDPANPKKPFESDDGDKIEKEIKRLQAMLKKLKAAADDPDEKPTNTPSNPKKELKGGLDPETAGRLTALEAKDRKRDKADTSQALATTSLKALAKDGYHVDEQTTEDYETFAGQGEDALKRFDASFRRNTDRDGPKTLEDALAQDRVDKDISSFQTLGVEALEEAEKLSRKYDELKDSSYGVRGTKQQFITRRLEAAGFKAAG